jgi:hypothetical protein
MNVELRKNVKNGRDNDRKKTAFIGNPAWYSALVKPNGRGF